MPTNTSTARGANSRAEARRTISQAATPASNADADSHTAGAKAPARTSGTVAPNAKTIATHSAKNSRPPVTTLSQRGACPAFVGALAVTVIGTLTG
jgi:hypothetical protein